MDNRPPAEEPTGHRNVDPDVFTLLATGFEFGMVPLAWFVAWSWSGPPIPSAHWSTNALLLGVAATVPPLIVFAIITFTPVRELSGVAAIRDKVREILGSTLSRLEVWQMALVSLGAGVGEEVLFRGALVSRLGDGLIGICLSGVLFGLLHWITPLYAVLAAVFGVFLGWLLIATDNLFVPIVVHSLYDLVALIVVRRELRKDGFPGSIDAEVESSAD
jgi:membrane protease YdiL (CAAX protease family)